MYKLVNCQATSVQKVYLKYRTTQYTIQYNKRKKEQSIPTKKTQLTNNKKNKRNYVKSDDWAKMKNTKDYGEKQRKKSNFSKGVMYFLQFFLAFDLIGKCSILFFIFL